jgi:hypothetical protein
MLSGGRLLMLRVASRAAELWLEDRSERTLREETLRKVTAMGWEMRRGKRVYYRKVREGGRVRSIYCGSGERGEEAAREDEARRLAKLSAAASPAPCATPEEGAEALAQVGIAPPASTPQPPQTRSFPRRSAADERETYSPAVLQWRDRHVLEGRKRWGLR